MIFKEAINNTARHASATKVTLLALVSDKRLIINLKDNGKGFDEEAYNTGNGLGNLQKTADKIKAKLIINSQENVGTEIQLMLN